MYQTFFLLPFIVPIYSGNVTVPCAVSTVPDLSNCSGPTKLGLSEEGGGPKYESGTDAPTLAGAGNTLHPGPGPMGPGPGPCAALKLLASAVCTDGAAGCGLLWACAICFV